MEKFNRLKSYNGRIQGREDKTLGRGNSKCEGFGEKHLINLKKEENNWEIKLEWPKSKPLHRAQMVTFNIIISNLGYLRSFQRVFSSSMLEYL